MYQYISIQPNNSTFLFFYKSISTKGFLRLAEKSIFESIPAPLLQVFYCKFVGFSKHITNALL